MEENQFIEGVLPGATKRELTSEEMDHYRAPYHDALSRRPLWRWPNEIPIEGVPADVNKVVLDYAAAMQQWDVPKLLMHAEPGGLVGPELVAWAEEALPNLSVVSVGAGIHYLQEDHPHEIGEAIAGWLKAI